MGFEFRSPENSLWPIKKETLGFKAIEQMHTGRNYRYQHTVLCLMCLLRFVCAGHCIIVFMCQLWLEVRFVCAGHCIIVFMCQLWLEVRFVCAGHCIIVFMCQLWLEVRFVCAGHCIIVFMCQLWLEVRQEIRWRC